MKINFALILIVTLLAIFRYIYCYYTRYSKGYYSCYLDEIIGSGIKSSVIIYLLIISIIIIYSPYQSDHTLKPLSM